VAAVNLALVAERGFRYTTAASGRRIVAAGCGDYPLHESLRGRDDRCSVAAGGSGLARRPAVDEAEDAVSGCGLHVSVGTIFTFGSVIPALWWPVVWCLVFGCGGQGMLRPPATAAGSQAREVES
jgi:hypothetical protein